MQSTSSKNYATFAVLALVAGLCVLPVALDGQVRSHDRVLILAPEPRSSADSNYVFELAEALRQRAGSKYRHKWVVISSEVVQDLFVSSGFPANTIIGPDMVEQVARTLQAHCFLYGWMSRREAVPVATFRLVDLSRCGLSGWMTVLGQPGDPPRSLADRVADSLENQVKAADYAKDCTARRDRSDFKGARDRAGRAFEIYPNHPASAKCLSYVYEATQQPADSLIWAYEKATVGDSLNIDAWEDLARQYMRSGDTVSAVGAYRHLLDANPADTELRFRLAAGYFTIKEYDNARMVIEEGLSADPSNVQLVQLKQRTCLEGQIWDCALEASSRLYELDSALVGNNDFYQSIYALADEVGDSAAMLRWSGEAVSQLDSSVQFWQLHAQLLENMAMKDTALAAYKTLVALDSTDFRTTLKVAQLVGEGFTADTLTPLDTVALAEVRGWLERVTSLTDQPDVVTLVGVEYLKGAQKLVQSQNYQYGVEWSEQALAHDPGNRLTEQGNFWLGYGLFFLTTPMDAQIIESKSCTQIGVYGRYLQRASQALTTGRGVSEQTADQLLGYLAQLRGRPAQFRQAFKCP